MNENTKTTKRTISAAGTIYREHTVTAEDLAERMLELPSVRRLLFSERFSRLFILDRE